MAALFKAVNLEVKYHTRQATLTALHNVSFEVEPRENRRPGGRVGLREKHDRLGSHAAAAPKR